jgi:catalase
MMRSLLVIGAALATLCAGFAVAAGWLPASWPTQGRLRPGTIVNALEAHDGRHPGFRRAHAKGLCIEGSFLSNGSGAALSKATLFAKGDTAVIGRFSTGGGNPYASDGRLGFRSLALSLTQPDGEQWRTAMDDTPMFPVATPQDFLELQRATAPDPKTGKPDADRAADFLARHPETQAFMKWLQSAPLSTSFANDTYYSINAFRFTNADGETRLVRWSFEPETPFAPIDKATLAAQPQNFLFDDVIKRLQQGPLRWHVIVTIARPTDVTDDATHVWSPDRRRVDVGTLVIDRALAEETGDCRNITFDPLILPSGMGPSDDPLLPARSATYASSLARRDGEKGTPSAFAADPGAQRALR